MLPRTSTALLLLCLWATPAAASDVALLPPYAEAGVPAALAVDAQRALSSGLQGAGHVLRDPDAVREALPEALRQCRSRPCVADARAALDVQLAAFVQLFAADAGHSVSVSLADDSGTVYQGTGYVTPDSSVGGAVRTALAEALDKQARGRGPWLTVEGQPEGATVLINGEAVAHLPATLRVVPGPLQLQVRQPGYREHSQMLNVQSDYDHHSVIVVQLRPASQAVLVEGPEDLPPSAPPRAPAEAAPSAWNLVLGITAMAAGAVYAGVAVAGLLREGDCVGDRDADGACGERAKLGVRFWSQVGAGAALLGGGTYMLVAQPIPGSTGGPDGATLGYRGRF